MEFFVSPLQAGMMEALSLASGEPRTWDTRAATGLFATLLAQQVTALAADAAGPTLLLAPNAEGPPVFVLPDGTLVAAVDPAALPEGSELVRFDLLPALLEGSDLVRFYLPPALPEGTEPVRVILPVPIELVEEAAENVEVDELDLAGTALRQITQAVVVLPVSIFSPAQATTDATAGPTLHAAAGEQGVKGTALLDELGHGTAQDPGRQLLIPRSVLESAVLLASNPTYASRPAPGTGVPVVAPSPKALSQPVADGNEQAEAKPAVTTGLLIRAAPREAIVPPSNAEPPQPVTVEPGVYRAGQPVPEAATQVMAPPGGTRPMERAHKAEPGLLARAVEHAPVEEGEVVLRGPPSASAEVRRLAQPAKLPLPHVETPETNQDMVREPQGESYVAPRVHGRLGGVLKAAGATQPEPLRPSLETLGGYAVKCIRYLVSQGQRTLQVRLIPESLGELRLSVTTSGDTVSVQFVSPNAAVREVLEAQVAGLREALARDGIDMAKVTVSSDLPSDQASPGQQDSRSFGLFGPQRSHALRPGPHQDLDVGSEPAPRPSPVNGTTLDVLV